LSKALILAGHGSHISPNTAGIVWEWVDELRRLNVADEITAAFWKEFPSFHHVIDTLTADDITVVPVFTARGYFTRTVIPAEMALTGEYTVRDGRMIRYTPTLGEHPALNEVALRRVKQALLENNLNPAQTAVAVIGHGTKRSSESRITTESQANIIRAAGLETVAVYLDDTPSIPDIYHLTSAPNIIAVPYFLALGSHTTIDVPQNLGLEPGASSGQVDGRAVYYTPPVGADNGLCEIIMDLAQMPPRRNNDTPVDSSPPLHLWERGLGGEGHDFPAAGRDKLISAVHQTGQLIFGQLHLTPHRIHVIGEENPATAIDTPSELRRIVRGNPFRPLPTSHDLPGGWFVDIQSPHMLHAVVETVYPGMVAEWAGHIQPTPLESVIARQTGMFRDLAALTDEQQAQLTKDVCATCVRYSVCAEPCNFWMSKAKEVLS
jgi:sirohydrochlorin cobaltochelatase